jgi:hypothetical protein
LVQALSVQKPASFTNPQRSPEAFFIALQNVAFAGLSAPVAV